MNSEPARLAVRDPLKIALATGAAAIALVAAWTSWQPQRAVAKGSEALGTAEAGNYPQARAQIADAERINPLSVDLLFQQSAIAGAGGDLAGARRALQEAVRKEPANPATWLNKGRWDDQFTPAHAVPRHLLTEVWRDQPAGKVELR